jgi:hypothetical protein
MKKGKGSRYERGHSLFNFSWVFPLGKNKYLSILKSAIYVESWGGPKLEGVRFRFPDSYIES